MPLLYRDLKRKQQTLNWGLGSLQSHLKKKPFVNFCIRNQDHWHKDRPTPEWIMIHCLGSACSFGNKVRLREGTFGQCVWSIAFHIFLLITEFCEHQVWEGFIWYFWKEISTALCLQCSTNSYQGFYSVSSSLLNTGIYKTDPSFMQWFLRWLNIFFYN